jgi:hypothetical protein
MKSPATNVVAAFVLQAATVVDAVSLRKAIAEGHHTGPGGDASELLDQSLLGQWAQLGAPPVDAARHAAGAAELQSLPFPSPSAFSVQPAASASMPEQLSLVRTQSSQRGQLIDRFEHMVLDAAQRDDPSFAGSDQTDMRTLKTTLSGYLTALQEQLMDERFDEEKTCNASATILKDCKNSYFNALPKEEINWDKMTEDHKQCRQRQKAAVEAWKQIKDSLPTFQAAYQAAESAFQTVQELKSASEECRFTASTIPSYYFEMINHWEKKNKTYVEKRDAMSRSKTKAEEEEKKLEEAAANVTSITEDCNELQSTLESESCQVWEDYRTGCRLYDECYDKEKVTADEVISNLASVEANLQSQWHALLRIECYLDAIVQPDIVDRRNKVEECKSKTYALYTINRPLEIVCLPTPPRNSYECRAIEQTPVHPGSIDGRPWRQKYYAGFQDFCAACNAPCCN